MRIHKALAAFLLPLCGCGIAVSRDLSKLNPSNVVFDDACGLQPYFDEMKAQKAEGPSRIQSMEFGQNADGTPGGGRDVFRFEYGAPRRELERVLAANFRDLPPELVKAHHVDIELLWARRAATKRALTDHAATLTLDGKSYRLPYHVCVADLLYGEPLYRLRAEMQAGR